MSTVVNSSGQRRDPIHGVGPKFGTGSSPMVRRYWAKRVSERSAGGCVRRLGGSGAHPQRRRSSLTWAARPDDLINELPQIVQRMGTR
jgi:hypothetical protein